MLNRLSERRWSIWSAIATAGVGLAVGNSAQAAQLTPNPNPAGNTIFIEIGDDATNDASFLNLGNILIEGDFANNGIFDNLGSFETVEISRDVLNNGVFNNSGLVLATRSFSLRNAGRFLNTGNVLLEFSEIANDGYFENNGVIAEEYEVSVLINNGVFVNNNSLDIVSLDSNTGLFVNRDFHETDGVDAEYYRNEPGGTILNNGLTLVRTYLGPVGDRRPRFINSGLLKGSGTYITEDKDAPFVLGPGSVAPGGLFDGTQVIDTAGTLAFVGDTVLDGGRLDISIGGFGADSFDLLKVAGGSASLSGGTIGFSWLEGFDINSALGFGETKTLSFLTAEAGIETFESNLDFSQIQMPGLDFGVVQQGDELVFSVTRASASEPTPVPEPGGWLWLGAAAAGIGHRRRWL